MSSVQLLRERFGGTVSNPPSASYKFVRPRKELMTKLKPKVDNAGEKDGTADEKETEEKEVEENEKPQKSSSPTESTSDPIATAQGSENEGPGDKGDDDQLFNFDMVVGNSRLSSQAARHKMGVVRNAKQKRQRPARTRSVDPIESKKLDFSTVQISLDDEPPTQQDKPQDEEENTQSSVVPPASSESGQEIEPKKSETEEQVKDAENETKSVPRVTKVAEESPKSVPRVTKVAEESPKSVPRVTKGAEDSPKSVSRVTKGAEEVLKSNDTNVLKTCAEKHGEAHAAIQTPSETVASRIFTSAKTSILDSGSGGPTRPTQLKMTISKQPKTSDSPSSNSKKSPVSPLPNKSPVTSHTTTTGTKKSPTSPGTITASLANKSQVESQVSDDASPEGYSSSRRRSSIRDLARRFEVDDSDDSKASPEVKSEEVSNTKRPVTKAANGNSMATSGRPAVGTTSPRKLSQPIMTSPPAMTSPQRKASESAIKKSIGPSTIATRISKLTEKPAATEKAIETSRPRASTTSSINERANVFREGTKPTAEVRKLSVNAGERPRTKVMDMMKKFET